MVGVVGAASGSAVGRAVGSAVGSAVGVALGGEEGGEEGMEVLAEGACDGERFTGAGEVGATVVVLRMVGIAVGD